MNSDYKSASGQIGEKKTCERPGRRALTLLAGTILGGFFTVGLIVFLFDPMFHYHKPWFGLKAVLTEKEYQVVGTLRHFDYDSLIAGSSVTENNNNAWFNEAFDCQAIKAARSYGGNGDLCYLLDIAFERQELKYVFYNIDPSSLTFYPELTYEETGCPVYLYDRNPFNDVKYLFNKDILLEKIPYMIANSLMTDYDENLSYNWEKGKNFSVQGALSHYERPEEVSEMMPERYLQEELTANIKRISSVVQAHPDTEFIFFLPPYSMLFWDYTFRNGELEAYLYNERELMKALLSFENVRFFCFQSEEDIVMDLDQYMDTLHFRSEINYRMVEMMAAGQCEVTAGEEDRTTENIRKMVQQIEDTEIKRYYPE